VPAASPLSLEKNMNKKIPLLFLAIFITGALIVFYNYSISVEQSLKANSKLLTSQGKTKLEIDSTLSMIESQYKSTFLKDILILFFGVFIGAIPTFILYWQQMRNQKKEEEIKIISDTLNYIFASNNSANNLLTDKSFLDKCKIEWPDKIAQVEKEMYSHFDSAIQKDFFPNLMLHSFHLKRLRDQSFWKDFENLMNIYQNFTKMLIDQKEEKEYSELNNQYKSMMKKFVEKCIKKSKINL
jgi:hypothetical protein